MYQEKKILIIGSVWPEYILCRDNAAINFSFLKFFLTFTSPAMDSDFMIDLELVGVVKNQLL
jgi:hypothetical protein